MVIQRVAKSIRLKSQDSDSTYGEEDSEGDAERNGLPFNRGDTVAGGSMAMYPMRAP
jgi:hypothetical protein